MASLNPGRRTTKNARKAENVIPEEKGARNGPTRHTRTNSSSKLPLPIAASSSHSAKSNVLAPTASSKAKAVDLKGEKRKRAALAEVSRGDKNAPNDTSIKVTKTTTTTSTTSIIPRRPIGGSRSTARSRTASGSTASTNNESTTVVETIEYELPDTKSRHDDRMQTSDDMVPQPALLDPVNEDEEWVEEQPPAKRQHTMSPPSRPERSEDDAEQIAQELYPVEEDAEAEAEAETQDWDDLDAEDAEDELLVGEYAAEVHKYLKDLEIRLLPRRNYMAHQPTLKRDDRHILVDWIVQLHHGFRFQSETLFIAINLLDRFLSARQTSHSRLQLVGLICLFVAAKYEETYVPSLKTMLSCILEEAELKNENVMKDETAQFTSAERYLLQTLDWDLRYSGPMNWLRRTSRADDMDPEPRLIGKYLLEIAANDYAQISNPPSLQGAAAMWLGRLVMGKIDWTPNLRHFSTYEESEVVPCATLMLNALLRPKATYNAVFAKYSGKKFSKVALLVRQWAVTRWQAGEKVDLMDDLAFTKEQIKVFAEQERRQRAARQLQRQRQMELEAQHAV